MSSGEESEENHSFSDGDSTIPSPTDDTRRDPSISYTFKLPEPKSDRVTRGKESTNIDAGGTHQQQSLKRYQTSDTLTLQGVSSDLVAAAAAAAETVGASSGTQVHSKLSKVDKNFKMDQTLKDALLEVATAFCKKQNAANFTGDLPYFGVPVEVDLKKYIIPISAPNRFLDTINAVCDREEYTDSGKIAVMKSRLLGPAIQHFNWFEERQTWAQAREHLLLLYPEVESYTTVNAKCQSLKREKQEQIGAFAGRIRVEYDTLRRLHPSPKYDKDVQEQDMILKILEVLPISERKFIQIANPTTFYEVLKQILAYCEREAALKLSIADIKKEQKMKSGAFEVNIVASGSQTQKQESTGQTSGGKTFNNPAHANFTCTFCNIRGHVQKDCKKRKYAESQGALPKNNVQSNKGKNNDSNFKFNPKQNSNNRNNGSEIRCTYCGLKGHMIATCRHRQKAAYQSNNTISDVPFCKYCKGYGHLITICRKRIEMEQIKSKQHNNVYYGENRNANGNNSYYKDNPRRCYRCQSTTHIAKFCNNNFNSSNNAKNSNQNF